MESKGRGVLDTPLEPVIGLAEGETRWRGMTAVWGQKQSDEAIEPRHSAMVSAMAFRQLALKREASDSQAAAADRASLSNWSSSGSRSARWLAWRGVQRYPVSSCSQR